jgi:hypothetical protein
MGLFGLSPGITIGNSNSTLYIYGLIPLIAAIFCIKKILKYWQGYGTKFKHYHVLLRNLPLLIFASILAFSSMVSPSLLDRMYFAVISQRNGLQSVTRYDINKPIFIEFTENNRTVSYDLAFGNHSNETVEFNVELIHRDGYQGIFVKEDNGELKIFSLPPKRLTFFSDEFTEYQQSAYGNGSSTINVFSVVLINGDEQYIPKPLAKPPLL